MVREEKLYLLRCTRTAVYEYNQPPHNEQNYAKEIIYSASQNSKTL